MERLYETTADLARNYARQSRVNRDEDGYFDSAITICENCGRTEVELFAIDGLFVCDDCAEEQQRVEEAAAAMAAADRPCAVRRHIIATAQTPNQLLNRLRAHEMAACAICGRRDPETERHTAA